MNTKFVADLAERAGWTFAQAVAGSVSAAGTASTLHTFDWRAAGVGGLVAAVLCVLKVAGVRLSTLTSIVTAAQQLPGATKAIGAVENVPVLGQVVRGVEGQMPPAAPPGANVTSVAPVSPGVAAPITPTMIPAPQPPTA